MSQPYNKWTEYFKKYQVAEEIYGNQRINKTPEESQIELNDALYATFFSSFESGDEFGLQVLSIVAAAPVCAVVAAVAAFESAMHFAVTIPNLFTLHLSDSEGEYKPEESVFTFTLALFLLAVAIVAAIATALLPIILLASLLTRSATTLYTSAASFFAPAAPSRHPSFNRTLSGENLDPDFAAGEGQASNEDMDGNRSRSNSH